MTTSWESREEWTREFPWLARLRAFSPVTERVSFLWPRYRADSDEWWLYQAEPAATLTPGRVAQFQRHWSELPVTEQMGRRRFVTEYQFWMYQTHRLDVTPFWVLQGSRLIEGGTPYSFTERERRLLEAEGFPDAEPIPPGTLPNIPFDTRVIEAVAKRDKLLQVGGDLDALEKQNRPEYQRAQDAIAEQEYRKTFLKWHRETMAPQSDFMAWYGRKSEADMTLPQAPDGLANTLADWRDEYVETGSMKGAGHPASRVIQVAVK